MKEGRNRQSELREVYSLIREAMNKMAEIPDSNLAYAKKQMYVLEDLLWQAITDDRRE